MAARLCKGCWRPHRVCLCSAFPSVPLSTQGLLVILQHPFERRRTLATVPLLSKTLQSCVIIRDRRFQAGKHAELDDILDRVACGSIQGLLLFPSAGAAKLQSSFTGHAPACTAAEATGSDTLCCGCKVQGPSVSSKSDDRPHIAAGLPAVTEQTQCDALSVEAASPCSMCQRPNPTGVHCAHQYVLFAIDGTWQEAKEIHKNVLPRLLAAGVKQVQLALHEPLTQCSDWLPSLSEAAISCANRPQASCTESASGQESFEAASEVARQGQGQGQGHFALSPDDSVAGHLQLKQAVHHAQAKLDDLAAKPAHRQPAADPADMTAKVPELQQTQLDLKARAGNPDARSKGIEPATSTVAQTVVCEGVPATPSVAANDTSCGTLHRGRAVGQGRSVAQGRAVDQGRAEDPDTAVGQGRAVGQARAATQSQQNVSWLLRTEPVAGCVTTAEAVARALAILEGDDSQFLQALLAPLQKMTELQACFDPAVRLRMQSQLLSFDKSRGSVDNPAPGRAQDLLV